MPDLKGAIEFMRRACDDWSLGYDQNERWDIFDGGESDCSSLVITALKRNGFDVGSATYTGNMSYNLTRRGWKRLSPDIRNCQPGDILLNDTYHTCMVISGKGWDARIAQASIDERGRATGGRAGDQTGHETNTRGVYTYSHGWNCILRYEDAPAPEPAPAGKLDVDGVFGYLSTCELQRQLKTPVDGVVSGQTLANRPYHYALASAEYGSEGSLMVEAMQRRIIRDGFSCGAEGADGHFGQGTILGLQRWLCSKGYKVAIDGYFGPETAKAMQRSLNDGKWK